MFVAISILTYGLVSPATTTHLSTTAPCMFVFLFVVYYFCFLFCRKNSRKTWNYNDNQSVQNEKKMRDVSIGVVGADDTEYRLSSGDLVVIYNQCGDSSGTV